MIASKLGTLISAGTSFVSPLGGVLLTLGIIRPLWGLKGHSTKLFSAMALGAAGCILLNGGFSSAALNWRIFQHAAPPVAQSGSPTREILVNSQR